MEEKKGKERRIDEEMERSKDRKVGRKEGELEKWRIGEKDRGRRQDERHA